MKLLLLALAASALAACVSGQPALASNIPVSGLPARGTPATTDLVPVLPVGATTLQQTTAGALLALGSGGSGVNLNGFSGVDPTGATDSTTAIQAAINTGQSLSCNGLYKISATLILTTTANHGQQISGLGPNSSLGTTANRCTFQPTAALTGFVFKIDGTPTSQYLESIGFSNLSVDLTNVTDAATNGAFNQIQAYDINYSNVRVLNDGNYKRAWLFNGGAFTTTLSNSQGNIVDFEGTNSGYETTTISLPNTDIGQIVSNYSGSVNLYGGAVQFRYITGVTPVLWVASGIGPYSLGAAGGGYYLAYQTDIKNSQFFQVHGTDFEAINQPGHTCGSGTAASYTDGTHGCAPIYMAAYIESTSFNTMFDHAAFSGMFPYDLGNASDFRGLSQNGVYGFQVYTGTQYDLGDFRVGGTVCGEIGFGGALGTETSCGYSIVGSTGIGTFRGLTIRPAADGLCIVCVNNAAGNNGFSISTSTGQVAVNNGGSFALYSDNETTQLYNVVDQSGSGVLTVYNPSNSANNITLNAVNGTIVAGNIYNTPVGTGTANTGAFTTLSASSTTSFPTPSPGDNTTKGATTAFVTAAITAATPAATTSTAGISALATGAQVITGTDTTHAVTAASLTSAQSVAANGYWDMPGGLYMEWGESGSVSANSSTGGAVTFPHACASAVYAITITPAQNMGTGGMALSYVTSVSTTGFTIFNSAPNAGPYYWQANCK